MNHLSLINAHPRDTNIRFQEEGHKYTILTDPDSKYTSCTTWNHSHFSKFDADAVITTMMTGKNWNPSNKYWGLTADQIKQQWATSGTAAANAGTQMHYQIECFMNEVGPDFPSKYTHQDLLNYYHERKKENLPKMFLDFVKDTPKFVPYRTEWLIYDEHVKISGSVDMVYENPDGSLAIYDWKRSVKIEKTNGFDKWAKTECISHLPDSNFWHYALQLNTYKTIIERNYGKRVSEMCLVRLHPDSTRYELLKVPVLDEEMRDLFNTLLEKV